MTGMDPRSLGDGVEGPSPIVEVSVGPDIRRERDDQIGDFVVLMKKSWKNQCKLLKKWAQIFLCRLDRNTLKK
jgi:hypothetical protein